MRIVFVTTDLAVPIRAGLHKKTLMLLRYLLDRGHDCRVLALQRPGNATDLRKLKKALPQLNTARLVSWRYGDAVEVFLGFLHEVLPWRSLLQFRHLQVFKSELIEMLREPGVDLVHFEGVALAPYLRAAAERPLVFSIFDSISLRQQRLSAEAPALVDKVYRRCAAHVALKLERDLLPQATKVHVVSDSERNHLRHFAPGADVQCIPLAVLDEELAQGAIRDTQPLEKRLFFSSRLDGYLGRGLLWFLTEVYPRVAFRFPDLQLTVLGNGGIEPTLLRQLGQPGITVIPWVDDYNAELRKAQIAVVPDLCGTGMKTRVLTAMALGRPVVGTPVAFEGIGLEHDTCGFRCESADEFVQAINSLLADEKLRAQVAEAGHRLVLTHHAINVIGKQWLELYDSAVEKFSARRSSAETSGRHIQKLSPRAMKGLR